MSKSAEAFRTISEVAEALDTPAHVLRFWESRFSQIRPVKRAGGRRYYRPSDVALLGGIRRLLHEDGLTIRGVQKILREKGVRHVAGLSGESFEEPAGDAAEAPAGLNGSEHAAASASDAAGAPPDTGRRDPGPAERQPDLFAGPDDEAGPEAPMEIDAVAQPEPGASVAVPIFQAKGGQGRGEAAAEGDGPGLAARLRGLDPSRAAARHEELARLYPRLADLRARLAGRS
ncbi:MAG: MerR family transcriptional regulator [Paracoccaceae bacterium]